MNHLILDKSRLEEGNGRSLERMCCTSVEVGTTRADGRDVLLGTKNPSDSPTGETESLCKTVDDKDVVFIDILDVLGGRDGAAVAVARVVVTRVELVADESGTATANILDLSQLRVLDNTAGRVAWVRGQNDGGTASNLFRNLVRMDVVSVLFGQRDGNSSKLDEL